MGDLDKLGIGDVCAIGEDGLDDALGAEVACEGPGIEPGDAEDVGLLEGVGEGGVCPVVGVILGKFVDDKSGDLDAVGFEVFGVDAGVADHRGGLDEDLTCIRRIREGFLVACHGGIEDEFCGLADGLASGAEGDAGVDCAIGENETGGRFVFVVRVHKGECRIRYVSLLGQ